MSTTLWSQIFKSVSTGITEGGLKAYQLSSSAWRSAKATHYLNSGEKAYFEIYVDFNNADRPDVIAGIATIREGYAENANYLGQSFYGWGLKSNGNKISNAVAESLITVGTIADYTSQCAVDLGTGDVWFGRNGVWAGDPEAGTDPAYTGISGILFPMVSVNSYNGYAQLTLRCATMSFAYPAPIGFNAWDDVNTEFIFTARTPVTVLRGPNIYDGGAYRIVGNVDELGVAGAYRVRLFDRQSARCIRETWSAADGSYAFNNIAYRNQGYFAIAFDHGNNPLNAAIADLITPEAMP